MAQNQDMPPAPNEETADQMAGKGNRITLNKKTGRSFPKARLLWRFIILPLLIFIIVIPSAFLLFLDSSIGHRLIVDEIKKQRLATGLHFSIDHIDGSIWHKMHIDRLRFYDLDGVFLEIPTLTLDWQLWDLWKRHWDIQNLQASSARLWRLPHLRSQGKPFRLPNNYIKIDNLVITHLEVIPQNTSAEKQQKPLIPVMNIMGHALSTAGQLKADLTITSTLKDNFHFLADINPEKNRFDLRADLTAPEKGVIADLAGFKKTLTANLNGKGQWQNWQGHIHALLDNSVLADISLQQNTGHWHIVGMAALSRLAQPKTARLLGSETHIKTDFYQQNHAIDGQIQLLSPTLDIKAKGSIDFGKGFYHSVVIETILRQTKAIDSKMEGEHITLSNHLDGSFEKGRLTYQLKAVWLSFGKEHYEDAVLEGETLLSDGVSRIPLKLTVKHISHTDHTTEDLTRDLVVNGFFHISDNHLICEKTTLSSHFLRGQGSLNINLKDGSYQVHVQPHIDRYPIPEFALLNIEGDINAEHRTGIDGVKSTGHLKAWTENFENAFLKGLMEGAPTLNLDFIRNTDGNTDFQKIILQSPALQLTAQGRRDNSTGNPLHLIGSGNQRSYGPLKLKLDGDIAHPHVDLQLDHPVDSLGLKTVSLTLEPTNKGYDWHSNGSSPLGAFKGLGRIDILPHQPTLIHVQNLDVSASRLAGDLTSVGRGFNGQLQSSGAMTGKVDFQLPAHPDMNNQQQIKIDLASNNGRLGGIFESTVRHGAITAHIQLGQNSSIVDGILSGEDIKGRLFDIGQLKGYFHLDRDDGVFHLVASGNRGQPFTLDSLVHLSRDHFSIEGQGSIAHIGLHLDKVAEITKDKEGGFRLDESRIQIVGGGSAKLKGYLGNNKTEGSVTLEKIPLSLMDVFRPGLGLGGYAHGQITWQQDQVTALNGMVNLTLRGLTRSGIFLSSRPVDAGIAAILNPEKLALRAVIQDNNQIVGRAQVEWLKERNLTPTIAQFRQMPMRAQIRFKGASETLWRLLGIDNIDLSGGLAFFTDINGSINHPIMTGKLAMNQGRLEGATTGLTIDQVQLQGNFADTSLIINHFSGDTSNKGRVDGKATVDFAAAQGIGLAIHMRAEDAVLINRDDFKATVSGDLALDSEGDGGRISGDIQIKRANYQLGKTSNASIPRLPIREINQIEENPVSQTPPKAWVLDLKTHAHNRLNVTGMGLDSEWRAELDIGGSVDNPSIRGRTDLIRGNYDFAGRRFTIDRGNIRFQGEVPVEPALDLTARATLNSTDATIHVTGTALKPEINFTSNPAMPEDELLAQLLFGSSLTNLSAPEALQLASALNQLRHGGANVDPINNVRKLARLDRLRITSSSQNSQKTAVAAGKYIGRHTYVEVETDGQGYSLTSVQFQINRWLSLLSSVSTLGRSSGNIRISKDY
ncbi:MAG: translocation/assembly module TamB domain-containing protein [Zymomonas mobilis]